jgi:hypothetical protein
MLEELESLLAVVRGLLPAAVKQDAVTQRRERRETFAVNLQTLNAEDLK